MTVNSIHLPLINRRITKERITLLGGNHQAISKEAGFTIKRTKCLTLPDGWIRQIICPPKNSEIKKKKVSYIGPNGEICRFFLYAISQKMVCQQFDMIFQF
jgi:hypothetical protein